MVKKHTNVRSRSSKRKPLAKHLLASASYVASHKHTGKRLSHRHTSHGFLLLLLIITGIILFLSLATFNAAGLMKSGSVNVTLTVPGAPPTVGAIISTPQKKSKMKQSVTTVQGTCPSGNIAAVYNNGLFSASTSCTPTNTFATNVQLNKGLNTLQAQNYDALNQPGPATENIEVAFEPDEEPIIAKINTPADISIDTSIPDLTPPAPSQNPCYSPEAPADTTQLGMVVPCVTRNIFVGETLQLPVVLWGGLGPYALSINWGDDADQLYSFATAGRYAVSHTYLVPKLKSISLRLADATGSTYQSEAVIEVNDDGSAAAATASGGGVEEFVNSVATNWLEASVPVYWTAVALFGGFWVGDIFQRLFGLRKLIKH